MKLYKRDLIKKIIFQYSLLTGEFISNKKGEKILNAVVSSIKSALASGEDVEIRNFGKFKIKKTKKRLGRNPATGEKIAIRPKKIVKFESSKGLKRLSNSVVSSDIELSDKLESLLEFANNITPSNWNIFYNDNNYIIKPGILNVHVHIPDYEYCEEVEENGEPCAYIQNNLEFKRFSFFSPISFEFAEALKKYGDEECSQIYMMFCPYFNEWMEDTMVHELAHISLLERIAQQMDSSQTRRQVYRDHREAMHGEPFQKELERMIIRTENKYGTKRTKTMRLELEGYRDGSIPVD